MTKPDFEQIFREMDALGITPLTDRELAAFHYRDESILLHARTTHYVGASKWTLTAWSDGRKHYVTDEAPNGYLQFCGEYDTEAEALQHYYASEQYALTD